MPDKNSPSTRPQAPRARDLIAQLQLQPHPEGGWYREVFRSTEQVMPLRGGSARSALTSIYFLLEAAQHSRWHSVLSDEVWVHLEGSPLELWTWEAANSRLNHFTLGPVSPGVPGRLPQQTVAAGLWQAARPQQENAAGYTLAACMVGPGFDFSDFRMMDRDSDEARRMATDHPGLAAFI
jgi:predicted cupin superfamily sugar epimerase